MFAICSDFIINKTLSLFKTKTLNKSLQKYVLLISHNALETLYLYLVVKNGYVSYSLEGVSVVSSSSSVLTQ